jgi:hypothetical protein
MAEALEKDNGKRQAKSYRHSGRHEAAIRNPDASSELTLDSGFAPIARRDARERAAGRAPE